MAKFLKRTKLELRAAENAFTALKTSQSREDYYEAWQSLLDRLEKIWRMAERECQPFRSKFEPWQGPFKSLRRKDPLLMYLHHARNADQHSIQPTAGYSPVGLEITIPPDGTAEIQLDRKNDRLILRGDVEHHKKTEPGFILVPVSDRGRRYDPPKSHLDKDIENTDPLHVAQKGLEFYRDFVQQLGKKFGDDHR